MNSRSCLVAIALAAALPFTLAACGGNSEADHAKASLKAMLVKDQKTDTATPRMSGDQSGCIANRVVDKIGVKQLQTAGLLDKKNNAVQRGLGNTKLSASEAAGLVDAMFDCTSGGTTIMASLKKEIHRTATGASAAALTCIDSKVTASFTKDLMKAIFAKDNAKAQSLQATLASCAIGTH